MRDTSKSQMIEKIAKEENLPLDVLCLNVDNSYSVKETIRKIHNERKQIDILVNNADYGIKQQFETNLFGAIRTIKEILSIMRKQCTVWCDCKQICL
jgi:NADP-dependent 3-hydroxy acid dehydrogenase YdfG